MRKSRFLAVIVGAGLAVSISAGMTASALATDTVAQISSFSDFRGDLANKPGTLWRMTSGPFNIPAASGGTPGSISNAFFHPPAPCTGCRITDMVPDLIFGTSTTPGAINATANLQDGVFLHHVVLSQPNVNDAVCPSNVMAQASGMPQDRFGGAGNERTHVHLPGNYGYTLTSPSFLENVHLQNMLAIPQTVWVQFIFRTRPLAATQPVTPLWFDIDGCGPSGIPGDGPIPGDAEYPAPPGYSDQHRSWTSTVGGRVVSIGGHFHDIDYAEPGCVTHCASKGGGYAVSAELNPSTPSSTYYGPNPASNAFGAVSPVIPTDLTGATLCRTEPGYNSSVNSAMKANGHLDTISLCGLQSDLPNGAEPEAYPVGGAYPTGGVQLNSGDVVKLHSQYWNNLGFTKPDAMGIMNAWLATRPQTSSGALRTALVPAFKQCGTGGNPATGAHNAPLSAGSCAPGTSSTLAHVGLLSTGVAMLAPVPDDPGTGGDEADMAMGMRLTDVRATSPTGTDYDPISGPDLRMVAKLRMTDSNNGGGSVRATLTDFDFGVPVDCATTPADGTIGSTCSVDTTVDTISPGAIIGAKQTSISLFRIRVNDGGVNNVLGDADDKLFAQQGFFAP